jgi:hypothetical protein
VARLSYVSSCDFRAAATPALAFTRTYHVQAWVGDDRLLGAVRPRDLEWVEQGSLRPLGQAGLERFAQDVLNSRIISSMDTRMATELPFAIRHFDGLLAVRAWASGS